MRIDTSHDDAEVASERHGLSARTRIDGSHRRMTVGLVALVALLLPMLIGREAQANNSWIPDNLHDMYYDAGTSTLGCTMRWWDANVVTGHLELTSNVALPAGSNNDGMLRWYAETWVQYQVLRRQADGTMRWVNHGSPMNRWSPVGIRPTYRNGVLVGMTKGPGLDVYHSANNRTSGTYRVGELHLRLGVSYFDWGANTWRFQTGDWFRRSNVIHQHRWTVWNSESITGQTVTGRCHVPHSYRG